MYGKRVSLACSTTAERRTALPATEVVGKYSQRRNSHVLVKRSKMACPSVEARWLICAHALVVSWSAFCSFRSSSRSLNVRRERDGGCGSALHIHRQSRKPLDFWSGTSKHHIGAPVEGNAALPW